MLDILKRAAQHAKKQPNLINLLLDPRGVIVEGRDGQKSIDMLVTWEQIALGKGDGVLLYAINDAVNKLKACK